MYVFSGHPCCCCQGLTLSLSCAVGSITAATIFGAVLVSNAADRMVSQLSSAVCPLKFRVNRGTVRILLCAGGVSATPLLSKVIAMLGCMEHGVLFCWVVHTMPVNCGPASHIVHVRTEFVHISVGFSFRPRDAPAATSILMAPLRPDHLCSDTGLHTFLWGDQLRNTSEQDSCMLGRPHRPALRSGSVMMMTQLVTIAATFCVPGLLSDSPCHPVIVSCPADGPRVHC